MKLNLPSTCPSQEFEQHPLLRGKISRWLWRVYTQHLTKAGRWFLLPTAAFTVYAGASLQLQGLGQIHERVGGRTRA